MRTTAQEHNKIRSHECLFSPLSTHTHLCILTFNDVLALNFDIGIAVGDRIIEFGQTIRPICLPFQPIDDADHLQGKFVNLAGWGTKDLSNDWVTTSLHIYNLKVCFNC